MSQQKRDSQPKASKTSPSPQLKLRSLIKRHTTFAASPSDLYRFPTKKSKDGEFEEDVSSSSKCSKQIISLENVGLCAPKLESPRNFPTNDYLLRPINPNYEKNSGWGSPSRLNSSKNVSKSSKKQENLTHFPSSNDFVNENRGARNTLQAFSFERTASMEEEPNSKGKRDSNRLKKGISAIYANVQPRSALKKSTLAITLENLRKLPPKTQENG